MVVVNVLLMKAHFNSVLMRRRFLVTLLTTMLMK